MTATLTDRQRDVLLGVLDGKTNAEIAQQLGVSHHTVKGHVTTLLQEAGCHSRSALVMAAIRRGWIRIEVTP